MLRSILKREASMLRRVLTTTTVFYTLSLTLARQHTVLGLNWFRLFSVERIEGSEFRKVRDGYKAKLTLDPFDLKEKEPKERHGDGVEWDPKVTTTVRSTLEKFSISPDQIEVSPLGYSEERVLTLVRLVEEFSDKLPMMDRSRLLCVLLLNFFSVKLNTNRFKFAIETIIQSGLDPSSMLAKQPTLIQLDLTDFTENARSLINIVMGEGAAWEELKFDWVVKHELKMLLEYSAREDIAERSEEADLVERMYETVDDGRLKESYIYLRIFQTIKETVKARKQSDTAVYKACEKVYSRLKRAFLTELCFRHFEEVVMGISPEFMNDLSKLTQSIGLKKGVWVERFISRVSVSRILVNSEQAKEEVVSKFSLLKEYGIDFNKSLVIRKCPKLLNAQLEDIQKSIEILQLSPFYLNKNDISKTISRDPSIFTVPDVLESTRQQILQIPVLRDFKWYMLVKAKPRVLLINIAKVFDVLEKHGFSDEEALIVLKDYQKFFGQIDSKSEELEKNLKPIITVVGFSQCISIIRKRISGIVARQKQSSFKDRASFSLGNKATGLEQEEYYNEEMSDIDD